MVKWILSEHNQFIDRALQSHATHFTSTNASSNEFIRGGDLYPAPTLPYLRLIRPLTFSRYEGHFYLVNDRRGGCDVRRAQFRTHHRLRLQ